MLVCDTTDMRGKSSVEVLLDDSIIATASVNFVDHVPFERLLIEDLAALVMSPSSVHASLALSAGGVSLSSKVCRSIHLTARL